MSALSPQSAPKPGPCDAFGCAAGLLHADQALAGSDIHFYRKISAQPSGQFVMPATERGFVVGVSMQAGHRRRIFRGQRATLHHFEPGAIYIRNLAEDYRADFQARFDFILMELPRGLIERTSTELGRTRLRSLREIAGEQDAVLAHLAHAMAPALRQPQQVSRLFVDQLSMAIGAHLVCQYGDGSVASPKTNRLLSARALSRAREMLVARLDGDVSIAEVADACHMSRSHFTRAFRDTTGQTPYQWLLSQRIERACALLRDASLPLAEVAVTCGFADQSHFTRAFSRATGATPGQWRRRMI
ncbi:AraC family transcriptional regulator [Cupriavidus agavae]|uniref:AraC-like DNA-binding protein n=1 Tax=Cupriavidus agavae TaxID=1001822 RepID=A0A4Q7RFV2_9BURK|nr:AraC family transcriptional regulator [Cupriavidus agavae]RZT30762.1 AraC-like DNA-binding protein [Cupriavidus agavae]